MTRSALACSLLLVASPGLLTAQQPAPPVPIDSVGQRPVLLDSACLTPVHPDILRQAGVEGRVVVQFVVDTTGAVDSGSVRVLTTTHRLFERPARAAIASCRFRPGSRGGQVVRVRMTQPLNFALPERRPE
jgi:TonB family protein